MSLRIKLLLAQLPLVVALVLLAFVATHNVSILGEHSAAILKDNYRSVLAAQRMKEAIERLHDLASNALVATPATAPQASIELRRRFETELQVEEDNITEAGEVEAVQTLRDAWRTYQDRFERLFSFDDPEPARRFFAADLEPSFAATRQAADSVLDINEDAIVQKSERVRRLADETSTVTITVSLAALLFGFVAATMLTTRLLQPLGLLARTVQRLGKGELDSRVSVSGNDELAQLAASVNAMAASLAEYRRSSLGELLLAQQESQAAIDSLPDPVIVFDVHGEILTTNDAAETLLGIGKTPVAELDGNVRAVLQRTRGHVLAGKGPYLPKGYEEAVAVPSREGNRYLLPRATPVYSHGGAITGATVVFQDVTRARLVDQLRNDLVATVADEFRRPLTSLRLAIHLCLEQTAGPLNDRQADLLYAARDDCDRLQSMIDELLDLARIQEGHVELHRRPTAAAALIDDAVAAHQKVAAERGIVLQDNGEQGLAQIDVDRDRIRAVLSNLINHAMRRMPAGGSIEVRATPVADAMRFEITAKGELLSLDSSQQLQASAGDFGSSVAAQIIAAHGGTMGTDAASRSVMFWFEIPSSQKDQPQQALA